MIERMTVALLAAILATPAWAATYDLRVHAFCKPGEPQVCGKFNTESDLRQWVRDTLAAANLKWKPNGVSFRPADGDLTGFVTIQYGTAEGYESADGTCGDDDGDLIKQLQDDYAAQNEDELSLFLLEGQSACFSGCGLPPGTTGNRVLGVFCGLGYGATAWSHEMGHQFCLAHTQSFADPPQDASTDQDGDNADSGQGDSAVLDTPADPGPRECAPKDCDYPCADGEGADFDSPSCGSEGDPYDGQQFCSWTLYDQAFCQLADPDQTCTDPGSPQASWCDPHCFEGVGGTGGTEPIDYHPLTQDNMSYYPPECVGPYVLNGLTHYAFTTQQKVRIDWCRANARTDLVDVCATRGGDSDSDGLCNQDDHCPGVASFEEKDGDGDGTPDACDLCPGDPGPNIDTDDDGLGDICDDDDDNDGCDDDVDQHPKKSMVKIGTLLRPGCDPNTGPAYGFEGDDSDGDGTLNCEETNDDDDRLPDALDPCPTVSGTDCIFFGSPCLEDDPGPGWFLTCRLGGCNGFLIKIVSAINPDPTTDFIVEKIRVVNDEIYLFPPAGKTLSETAGGLLGGASALARASAPGEARATGETLRMEIWTKDPRRLVATVAEYDPSSVAQGDTEHGAVLYVRPPRRAGSQMRLEGTWGVGVRPHTDVRDTDGDGIPDPYDACTLLANASQADADGDGFGDRCDPDLDGDGIVRRRDVAQVRACLGVALAAYTPLAERLAEVQTSTPASPPDQWRCAPADLDGNRRIDRADVRLAVGWLGRAPGPSKVAPMATVR